ncbi:hotdog family protein [Rheinheimera muenzenbergensis]|uniref:Hotdog family protein n=1 Tax=Rheinheimera muenzenbergensis TaxID=1193628 RepID=A0ABU8C5E2_9GAMM
MITGYPIEQVLPHAQPMILLDEFIEAGAEHAVCKVNISADSAFFDAASRSVPAYVGIEYMAQTVAAYAGAHKLAAGDSVRLGFLLGCRKYQPQVPAFAEGAELSISATKVVMDESGLSVFDCQIAQRGEVLVNAKLNVFEPEDYRIWLTE